MDETKIVEQLERLNETHSKILAVMEKEPNKAMRFVNTIAAVAGAAAILTVVGQGIVWVLGGD